MIRSSPAHGTLTKIESIDARTSKVIYQHTRAHGAGGDSFTYAVQAPNTGVSAAERVTIHISEPASVFDAPNTLTFDDVIIGDSSQKKITLKNLGGGIIKGSLEFPPPWEISDNGSYSLKANQSKSFTITFRPAEAREYRDIISYSNDPARRLLLAGTGLPPIEVHPPALELPNMQNGKRSALLEIVNIGKKPCTAAFIIQPIFTPIPDISLKAGESKKILISTSGKHLSAINSLVQIQCGAYKTNVPVTGFSIPAQLSFNPETLDFGKVSPGHTYHKTLDITNSGGTPITLRTKALSEITLSPDPLKTPINPEKTVSFEIKLEPGIDSRPPLTLEFTTEDKSIAKTTVLFVVENADPSSRVYVVSNIDTSKQEKNPPTQSASPQSIFKLAEKPRIEHIGVVEQGRNHLYLVWKKLNDDTITTYVIEQLMPKKKSPTGIEWAWVRPRNSKITMEGDYVHASLTGLPAGTSMNYRILTSDQTETLTPVSEMFRVSTKTGRSFRIPFLLVLIFALLATAFFIWRERHKQGKQLAEETSQIEGK
ncbi:MAG: choice-of-anchor D domain-containing protein [Chthoniobacterales bacterium]